MSTQDDKLIAFFQEAVKTNLKKTGFDVYVAHTAQLQHEITNLIKDIRNRTGAVAEGTLEVEHDKIEDSVSTELPEKGSKISSKMFLKLQNPIVQIDVIFKPPEINPEQYSDIDVEVRYISTSQGKEIEYVKKGTFMEMRKRIAEIICDALPEGIKGKYLASLRQSQLVYGEMDFQRPK